MDYELVMHNGSFITMDVLEPRVEWVAVKNGRIAAKGTGDHPFAQETINLDGKTVLPGLFDSHCHVMTSGFFCRA